MFNIYIYFQSVYYLEKGKRLAGALSDNTILRKQKTCMQTGQFDRSSEYDT